VRAISIRRFQFELADVDELIHVAEMLDETRREAVVEAKGHHLRCDQ
jgi:hypothetical protein